MAEGTLLSVPIPRPEPTEEAPQHLCLDKGYDYDEVYGLLHDFGYTPHIKARGEEARDLKRDARAKSGDGWSNGPTAGSTGAAAS